jgi:hypothetical protein
MDRAGSHQNVSELNENEPARESETGTSCRTVSARSASEPGAVADSARASGATYRSGATQTMNGRAGMHDELLRGKDDRPAIAALAAFASGSSLSSLAPIATRSSARELVQPAVHVAELLKKQRIVTVRDSGRSVASVTADSARSAQPRRSRRAE